MIQLKIPELTKIGNEFAICFEDCVETLCDYLRVDYQMMFLDQFKTYYIKNVTDFSTDVAQCFRWSDQYLEYLSQYHGINLKYMENCGITDIVASELKKGKPAIMHLDVFYCPWDKLYQKIHNCHMGITTGIDDEYVFVCDPYDKVENGRLRRCDVDRHSQFIYTYSLEQSGYAKQDHLDIFRQHLSAAYETTLESYRQMYEFTMNRLRHIDGQSDAILDILFEFTRCILIKYANFSYLIRYLYAEKHQAYAVLEEKLNENVKTVYRLKNLSMKMKVISDQSIVTSIQQYFLSFIKNEAEFYELLLTP